MAELTITAIACAAGVRPSTLRYYEKIGLLPLARRVAGRRRYDVWALKQLALIAYHYPVERERISPRSEGQNSCDDPYDGSKIQSLGRSLGMVYLRQGHLD